VDIQLDHNEIAIDVATRLKPPMPAAQLHYGTTKRQREYSSQILTPVSLSQLEDQQQPAYSATESQSPALPSGYPNANCR